MLLEHLLVHLIKIAKDSRLTLSCRRPWAAAAGLRVDRPSPPQSVASPPPTVAEQRGSARSPCRVRRPNSFWHDADIRLPYSSQLRPPKRRYKRGRNCWTIQRSRAAEKWPRTRAAGPSRR